LLVTTSVLPSSPILVTLMKGVLISSETLVLTRATRRNIPENVILNSALFEISDPTEIFIDHFMVLDVIYLTVYIDPLIKVINIIVF
jgi:hypothetical protein